MAQLQTRTVSSPARGAHDPQDTRERLLDAAEQIFAARGFEGTSMRALTRAAGTSLSAANYHFGSKEALLEATLLRRLEPVNRARLAALDRLEGSQPGALCLEAVLDAYLRPLFAARASTPDPAGSRGSLAARLYADPSEPVARLKRALSADVNARFLEAFERALPDRDPQALALSQQLVIGMVVHVMSGHVEGAGLASLQGLLVTQAAAGLRATPAREVRS